MKIFYVSIYLVNKKGFHESVIVPEVNGMTVSYYPHKTFFKSFSIIKNVFQSYISRGIFLMGRKTREPFFKY